MREEDGQLMLLNMPGVVRRGETAWHANRRQWIDLTDDNPWAERNTPYVMA